jgi:lauroyl/myristoyl acyltransferase
MYYLFRLAGLIVPLIPPQLGYWLVDRVGELMYLFNRKAREAVFDNLRHVLGPTTDEARIAAVARQVLRNQLRNYFDLLRVPALSREQIDSLVDAPVAEVADEGLASGRGLVVVSLHFGNIDVVMQWLALHGYKAVLVIEHLKPEKLHRYVRKLRGTQGLRLVETDGAIKAIYRALQANEIVLLAADRDVTGSGRRVEFFGAPAHLPDGYARLAQRTGARLVVAFSRRCLDNTFKAEAWLAPEFPTTGDRQADEQTIMDYVLRRVEQQIRTYPEQWVMFQRIWELEVGG